MKLTTRLHDAEVKNAWTIPPLPQQDFMSWCLVKHRDKFTSTLLFTREKEKITSCKIIYFSCRKYI